MNQTPHSKFEEFRKAVFSADRTCDAEKRAKDFRAANPSKIVGALATARDWISLGIALRTLANEHEKARLLPVSWVPSEEVCRALDQNEAPITDGVAALNFERAAELKTNAETGNYAAKYTDRHRFLETAIELVWESHTTPDHENLLPEIRTKTKKEVFDFIAGCYLVRSRLTLPKGATIPEKKMEAIHKAWHWAGKGSADMDDLKVEIALEKDKWDVAGEENWLKSRLADFPVPDLSKSLHWALNDCGTHQKDEDVLTKAPTDVRDRGHYYKFCPLFKAKAAHRQGKDMSGLLDDAVKRLDVPLSHRLWEDTIGLMQKVADKKETDKNGNEKPKYEGKWENAAIAAWKKCRKQEAGTRHSLQVRWYWARARQLYDLAFRAALDMNDPALAASIADSHKSRPTVKLLAMEKSFGGSDWFKTALEAETTDCFNANLSKSNAIPPKEDKTRPITNVPEGWAAIHFYVMDSRNAYALVAGKNGVDVEKLAIEGAWNAYRQWEADWRHELEISENSLKKLCGEIGKMLGPVLEKTGKDNILFIPHGFLHLVPLHAAEVSEGRYLFQDKTCMYLPSWSLADPDGDDPAQQTETSGDIFISNWQRNLDELARLDWQNGKKTGNAADDLFDAIEKGNPRLLVLFCHGKSNPINPYLSNLDLKGRPLTHRMLWERLPPIKGTKVVLTACETDLASGAFGLTDEHLSLANAFFTRGAAEVLGTLFPCKEEMSVDLIREIKRSPNEPLCKTLREKQIKWMEKEEQTIPLYKAAVYRVMGFPSAK